MTKPTKFARAFPQTIGRPRFLFHDRKQPPPRVPANDGVVPSHPGGHRRSRRRGQPCECGPGRAEPVRRQRRGSATQCRCGSCGRPDGTERPPVWPWGEGWPLQWRGGTTLGTRGPVRTTFMKPSIWRGVVLKKTPSSKAFPFRPHFWRSIGFGDCEVLSGLGPVWVHRRKLQPSVNGSAHQSLPFLPSDCRHCLTSHCDTLCCTTMAMHPAPRECLSCQNGQRKEMEHETPENQRWDTEIPGTFLWFFIFAKQSQPLLVHEPFL